MLQQLQEAETPPSEEPTTPPWDVPPGYAALFAVVVIWTANTGTEWVPLIDNLNWLIHRVGDVLIGKTAPHFGVYGGTVAQIALPLSIAVYASLSRRPTLAFLMLIWLSQNLWHIARYLGDAQQRRTSFAGFGERAHDWQEILQRWGALESAQNLALFTNLIAWAIVAIAYLSLIRRGVLPSPLKNF